MSDCTLENQALLEAFEVLTQTTQKMEESHRRLMARVSELDDELAEKNRQLALTSDYLNRILDSMSDGVIAVDTRDVITAFNRAAGDILGYAPGDVAGRSFSELFGRDFLVPPGRQAMELRSSEGAPVTVSESDRPISDRKGERIGMVKVFQDLTEIEELRERILQKESLAAVGEMAMTVAHEIRNPLGGIRGFAALLARDLGDDDPKLRLVDRIVAGSRALERLVNELLEYTRPLQLRLRPVACRDVVESALALLESARDGVEVENAVPHGLVLHADADKLRQVLLNVLLNAVQALDGAGRVAVEAAEEDGHVAIGVSDTGCGMTQEQLGQVLTPFFTTKEKGTGLGLPVAAKIVEAHSGELELDSEPGCGSTVTLRLPKQV